MEEWEKYDYRFSLRICCYEADGKHSFTTPEYVYKAGTKEYALSGGHLQPDYGDPVFLEKLEAFLQKAGEKFNKDPRIELFDVGTIGTWGEGHTGYGDERIYPASVIKKHLELHAKYFPDAFVLMNDDYINAGWAAFSGSNEKTHATYASFHGFPHPWLERVPYLTEYCANRLGYWYFVEYVEISDINNGWYHHSYSK